MRLYGSLWAFFGRYARFLVLKGPYGSLQVLLHTCGSF